MYELFGWTALVAAIALGIAIAIGRRTRPSPAPEYRNSLLTWSIQLLVSMAAVFWIGFLGISTSRCAPDCEWDLLGFNFRGFMIATALIQFVTLVLIVLLRRRRKVWIVPAAAIALTAALCVTSSVIAYKAMLFF